MSVVVGAVLCGWCRTPLQLNSQLVLVIAFCPPCRMHRISSTRDRPNRKAIVTAAAVVPVDIPIIEVEEVRGVVVLAGRA